MRNSYRAVLVLFITVLIGQQASARVEQTKPCGRSLDSPNLDAGGLGAVLADVYDRSTAFRAQCDRIAAADNLQVSLHLDPSMPSTCLAFTVITRRGRSIEANVHLPVSGPLLAELLAHEFEHVLEQLEGLNLRVLAQARGFGVFEVAHDLFETERARRKGKIVADEVRSNRTPHPSAN